MSGGLEPEHTRSSECASGRHNRLQVLTLVHRDAGVLERRDLVMRRKAARERRRAAAMESPDE